MPKNNCKQCQQEEHDNSGKWYILGTDCSQALFDNEEDCQNYHEGYGQSTETDELSNFDLLFGGGQQVDVPIYGDSDYVLEGGIDDDGNMIPTGVGNEELEEDELDDLEEPVNNNTSNDELEDDFDGDDCECDSSPWEELPPSDPCYIYCYDLWIEQMEEIEIEEEILDDEEEEDDPCEGVDCGPNGVCVDGNCTCPEEDEELDPDTGKCKKKDVDEDEEEEYDANKFVIAGNYTLSGSAYEVPKNQEKSIFALAVSFNPVHTKYYKQHPNKDLPIFAAGQIQPGGSDADDLKYQTGEEATRTSTWAKEIEINPILHEMFCYDNGGTNGVTTVDGGGNPWSGHTTGYFHSNNFKGCFPAKGYHIRTGRHSHCHTHNTYGNCERSRDGVSGFWLFCAGGIAYTVDLFVAKYWEEISAGKLPGGQKSWKGGGSVGAESMVNKVAKLNGTRWNNKGSVKFEKASITKNPKVKDKDQTYKVVGNYCPITWMSKGKNKGTRSGPLLDTVHNQNLLRTMAVDWKGALVSFGSKHIGMVVAIMNWSTPNTAHFWTLEFNTTTEDSSINDGGSNLCFKRHDMSCGMWGQSYFKFADTTKLLGGSWAPKGLGNTDWMEDFFGVPYSSFKKFFDRNNIYNKNYQHFYKGDYAADPQSKMYHAAGLIK